MGKRPDILKEKHNNLDRDGNKIEFYEDLVRKGIIKKGGAAYERLTVLRGTTEDERLTRLRKFLNRKQKEK